MGFQQFLGLNPWCGLWECRMPFLLGLRQVIYIQLVCFTVWVENVRFCSSWLLLWWVFLKNKFSCLIKWTTLLKAIHAPLSCVCVWCVLGGKIHFFYLTGNKLVSQSKNRHKYVSVHFTFVSQMWKYSSLGLLHYRFSFWEHWFVCLTVIWNQLLKKEQKPINLEFTSVTEEFRL